MVVVKAATTMFFLYLSPVNSGKWFKIIDNNHPKACKQPTFATTSTKHDAWNEAFTFHRDSTESQEHPSHWLRVPSAARSHLFETASSEGKTFGWPSQNLFFLISDLILRIQGFRRLKSPWGDQVLLGESIKTQFGGLFVFRKIEKWTLNKIVVV